MSVFSKSTAADAARIALLREEAERKRAFAAQPREEAVDAWADDYLALAALEDAKAEVIEAELMRLQATPGPRL